MASTVPVSGHFFAVESEGKRIGIPHLFIETPKLCRVKDTCYICSNFKKMHGIKFDRNYVENYSYKDFVKLAKQYNTKNIAFDCGEFTAMDGFVDIIHDLYIHGYYITIATSGKVDDEILKYYADMDELLVHLVASKDLDLKKLHLLRDKDQIKVVINTRSHLELLYAVLAENPKADVFAVPVPKKMAMGKIPDEQLVHESEVFDLVCKEGLNCKVIAPQHMYIEGLE